MLGAVDRADQAVVTVTGPGGSGKTSLAVEVGHRLAVQYGRRWFVDLTALDRADDVAAHTAHRIGLRAGEQEPVRVLVDELRRGPALVVLDNCEHVLDTVAEMVGTLTAACPELTVLATSRRPLDVPAERVVALDPLAVDGPGGTPGPAVHLLAARGRSAGAGTSVDGPERADLTAVCRLLDGLPLAIVLAAPRLRTMSPGELADRLAVDLSLPALRGGAEHQRTLRASLDWSVDLLPAAAADLYRRAGVFAGAFDAAACAAVSGTGTTTDVPALLDELVEHSLLVADTTRSPTRYRMLAVVREHARATTAAPARAEVAVAHRRHLAAAVSTPHEGAAFFTPADVRLLEDVHDDAVAALDGAVRAGDAPAVTALLLGLLRYWRMTGRIRFGLDRTIAATPGLDGPARGVVLLVQADLERLLGRLDASEEHARTGIEAVRALGPAAGTALPTGLGLLGAVEADRGRYDSARALYRQARALYDPQVEPRLHAIWCANLGELELRAGDDDAAHRHLDEARRRFALDPHVWLAGRVHGHLGELAHRRGDLSAARDLVLAGLDRLADYDALAEAAPLVDSLGEILADAGRADDATRCRAAAAGMRRRVGSPTGTDDPATAEDALGVADVVALVRATRTPTADTGVLTPRETEVAGLVAEGLTNPQIARRLVISPGTARTHVERIRTKLGVSTRVQVARWVLDRYVERRTR